MAFARRSAVLIAVCALWACAANAQSFVWSEADAQKLSDKVSSDQYGKITSLWVEQNSVVIYEEYFNGAEPDTLHNMRSASKTVTGMLVGIAIDSGILSGVGTKAVSFFDNIRPFENNDRRKESITLEDLLTMSGPLECDDWNSYSRGNEERMYLVEDWSAFFFDLPIKNRPSWEIPDSDGGFGRIFTYCTAGAQLLGEIVERAAGEPIAEFAARKLFHPVGVINPKWNYASSGKAHLGGGLELTTADWARLARLYIDRGRVDSKQIVSELWVDASMADHVRIDPETNYGYLWWRPHYEVAGKTYSANMMSGSGGNRVYVLPEFNTVVVVTKSDFQDRDAHEKSDRLFKDEIAVRLKK